MKALPQIRAVCDEDERQLALLATPLGRAGSGMTRYAAAMYFHRSGRLDDDLLEAYRICCKLDHEDVLAVLKSREKS
ncbi:MAG: hypothetical protein KDJ80_10655 [Nitratireductor sp.]|nr:hypothetical protein [Nitratireductor sp.]